MKHSEVKEFAKDLTVLKNAISIFTKSTIKTVLILKLPELKEYITSYDYIEYLSLEISKDLINQEDTITSLHKVFSLDEREIVTDEEAKKEFIGKLYNLITCDYIKPFIEKYKADKISNLLNQEKALYESLSGEEVEILEDV